MRAPLIPRRKEAVVLVGWGVNVRCAKVSNQIVMCNREREGGEGDRDE